MRKLPFISFILLGFIGFSQQTEDSPLMGNGFVGYTQFNPNFKSKGFESTGTWMGLGFNFSGLNFSFNEGELREIGADSTVASTKANVIRMGYQMGPENWRIGKNSFLSASVKPFLGISGSVASASDRVLNDDVYSGGLVFSPGLELRFSHLYMQFSYDAGLYFNTSLFGDNGRFNIAKGFLGGTTFTVGLENAFDLLVPQIFTFKGLDFATEKYEKYNGVKYDSRRDMFYEEYIITTVTTYSPGERVLALVSPFWGVGPSYSFKAKRKRQAATSMLGANLGFRFWYLMLDAYYEEGTMGTADMVGREEILLNYPELRDYDFSAQITSKNYGGRVGLNLSKLMTLNMGFQQMDGMERKSRWMVPYSRFSVFYTMGKTDFLSMPVYTYSGASEKLADYQKRKGITPDASNNPDYIPQNTLYSGWGGSFELGAAYFNFTKLQYKDAAVANHWNFTVGANVPIGRIINSARAGYY